MQHLHMSQLPRVDPAGRCGPEQQHSNDHRLTPTWRHLTGNKHLSKQLRSHLVLQNTSWSTFVQHHLTQDREEAPSQKMCNCCNKYSTYPKKSTLLVCNPWPWVASREELGGQSVDILLHLSSQGEKHILSCYCCYHSAPPAWSTDNSRSAALICYKICQPKDDTRVLLWQIA